MATNIEQLEAGQVIPFLKDILIAFRELVTTEQIVDVDVDGVLRPSLSKIASIFAEVSGVYETVEEGTQNSSVWQYFFTVGGEVDVSRILWRKISAEESIKISEVYSTQGVQNLAFNGFSYSKKEPEESFSGFYWGVIGHNGNPYLAVKRDSDGVVGVFESYHGVEFFHPIYAQAATLRGELAYGVTHDGAFIAGGAPLLDTHYLKAYADHESGKVLYGVRHDGSFDAGTGVAGKSFAYTWGGQGNRQVRVIGEAFEEKIVTTGGDNWEPKIEAGKVVYLTDINGLTEITSVNLDPENPFSPFVNTVEFWLSAGQSLDLGSISPPVTIKPPLPGIVLTPNHGVRMPSAGALSESQVSALKPGAANVSEPPIVSQCVNAKELFINNENLGIVCATYAIGGQRIDQLNDGTVPYMNGIRSVESAFNQAEALGLPLSVPFVSWRQGEADINAGTLVADYQSALLQLQIDYETDLKAVTGQAGNIPILLDQVSSQTAYNVAESVIPLLQLDIALNNPALFTCVGPKYDIEYRDGIHPFAEGFFKIGARFAQAAAELRSGGTWLPVHAVSAVRTGTEVVVTFACPNGQLVIDDTLVSDPGNYGIRWIDNGDGNAVNVSGVALSATNELTVSLDTVPTGTGGKIGIADIGIPGNPAGPTTGARACLRDDSPVNDVNGDPIHHWACHQQINVTEV